MTRTNYDIYMRLCFYENAFKSALDGFMYAKKWSTRLNILQEMKDALSKRFSSEQTPTAIERNKMTSESITIMLGRIKTQTQIVEYCIKNKIPFSTNLEILKNKNNALFTATWLLKQYQFEIVLDMMQNGITPNSVFEYFLTELSKESPTAISKYCLSMPTKDEKIYETVITAIASVFFNMTTDKQGFKQFVDACVKVEQVKAQIYAQTGYLVEALNLMKKKKKENLISIKLIQEKAEKTGNVEALQLANSLLK